MAIPPVFAAVTTPMTWADLPSEVFGAYIAPRLSMQALQATARLSKRYCAMTIDGARQKDYRLLASFIDFFVGKLGGFAEEKRRLLRIAEKGKRILEAPNLNGLKTRLLDLRGKVLHVLTRLPDETLEGIEQLAVPHTFENGLQLVKIYKQMRLLAEIPMTGHSRSGEWKGVWHDLTQLGETSRAVPFVPESRRDEFLCKIGRSWARKGSPRGVFRAALSIKDQAWYAPILQRVFGMLVEKGDRDKVFRHAQVIADGAKRDFVLRELCFCLARQRDIDRAFREVQSIGDESKWGPVLATICRYLVEQRGDQVFGDILAIQDAAKRDTALSSACIALVQPWRYSQDKGLYTQLRSEKEVNKAFEMALEIHDQQKLAFTLSVVCKDVYKISDKIHAIADRERRDFVLITLCYSLAKRGLLEEVFKGASLLSDEERFSLSLLEGFRRSWRNEYSKFKLTQTIRDEERRDRALSVLCQALAERGCVDGCLRAVGAIHSNAWKQCAISVMGEPLARRAQNFGREWFWHLLLYSHEGDRELLQRILEVVCSALVCLGDVHCVRLAFEGGQRIVDQDVREIIFLDVCKAWVGLNCMTEALHAARAISDEDKRRRALDFSKEKKFIFFTV